MSTASFDFSKYEEEPSVFDFSKYEEEKPTSDKNRAFAILKGLVKGSQNLRNPLQPSGPISVEKGLKLTDQVLPTSGTTEEKLLERGSSLIPIVAAGPESLASKAAQLGGGLLAGQLAEENDIGPTGQAIAEVGGMGLGNLLKGGAQRLLSKAKSPIETLPSGITKSAALESKTPSRGVITPDQQEKAIASLNDEAANLARKSAQENLPLLSKIESGHDFGTDFEKGFGQLQRAAKKSNPTIDLTPVSDLLISTRKAFRGIPKLHEDARKVMKEVNAFYNNPPTALDPLLRTYRSDGQKIKHIYESSRLTGKQQEYVDFLVKRRKAIEESIKNTLPEDSAWVKRFEQLNSEYSNYKKALKTIQDLQPVLGKNATLAQLERLATDKKKLHQLTLSMGEKGAGQIRQIAQDLKDSVEAIKKISVKKMELLDHVLPLSIFIPHHHGLGTLVGAHKLLKWSRRGYGYFLATPARRKEYIKVLEAIRKGDQVAYYKAGKKLLDMIENEES